MIVVQFDGRYHPWAIILLRSLARHESDLSVLADTVNLDAEQERELRQCHARVALRAHQLDPPPTPWQMANRKPFVLREAIDQHTGAPFYALFDADMLVRRPLPDLWRVLDRAPLGLLQTDGTYNGRYAAGQVFNSSLVLVRPDAVALVDGWCRWAHYAHPLGGVEPGRWFWDQLTLLMSWCENTHLESVKLAWERYADWRLDGSSAIWSANVPADCKARYLNRYRQEIINPSAQ